MQTLEECRCRRDTAARWGQCGGYIWCEAELFAQNCGGTVVVVDVFEAGFVEGEVGFAEGEVVAEAGAGGAGGAGGEVERGGTGAGWWVYGGGEVCCGGGGGCGGEGGL